MHRMQFSDQSIKNFLKVSKILLKKPMGPEVPSCVTCTTCNCNLCLPQCHLGIVKQNKTKENETEKPGWKNDKPKLVRSWAAQGAQSVRTLSWHINVAGWIPGQGTYKDQPMNAQISGTTNQHFSLPVSLLLSPFLSLKKKKINKLVGSS